MWQGRAHDFFSRGVSQCKKDLNIDIDFMDSGCISLYSFQAINTKRMQDALDPEFLDFIYKKTNFISGNIYVHSGDISFQNLREVSGNIFVNGSLRAQKLEKVSGDIHIVGLLHAPELRTIYGSIDLSSSVLKLEKKSFFARKVEDFKNFILKIGENLKSLEEVYGDVIVRSGVHFFDKASFVEGVVEVGRGGVCVCPRLRCINDRLIVHGSGSFPSLQFVRNGIEGVGLERPTTAPLYSCPRRNVEMQNISL
jgi:hypothetical protein